MDRVEKDQIGQLLRQDLEERKRLGEKVLLFSDIDETLLESTRADDLRQRPLGAALHQLVAEYDRGFTAFVTARTWDHPTHRTMRSPAWLSCFFDLYTNGISPELTRERNSICLMDPPPKGMRNDDELDLHCEMYKQKQRMEWSASKYAEKRSIWLSVGDNLWDVAGSHRDNPFRLECDKLLHSKHFGKGSHYILFGDGKTKMPPTCSSKYALLLSATARAQSNERKGMLESTPPLSARVPRAPPAHEGHEERTKHHLLKPPTGMGARIQKKTVDTEEVPAKKRRSKRKNTDT